MVNNEADSALKYVSFRAQRRREVVLLPVGNGRRDASDKFPFLEGDDEF